LQVIRGELTADQLAPDAAPCHAWDILEPDEVVQLRRCSLSRIYQWAAEGVLQGPAGKPIRFFGWSVLELLKPAAAPPVTATPSPSKPEAPTPRPTHRAKAKPKPKLLLPFPGRNRSKRLEGSPSPRTDGCNAV